MKFLFFDIECSNCFNNVGKMCEFGYVLTDENLKTITSDDIPMSPGKGSGNRFNLKGRKHEKDLELAYEYEFYYAQPEFPAFYNRIKKLMEDPDTICFAYSMENDLAHIYNSCERYKKPPLKFDCYDVQMLVARYLEREGQMALKKACLEIVGTKEVVKLQEHLSRDDAQMERMIFEAICLFEKSKPLELLEKASFAKMNSIDFIDVLKQKKVARAAKIEGRQFYQTHISKEDELLNPENIGKRYNVTGALKKKVDKLKEVVEEIEKRNGLFAPNLSMTDFVIALNDENKAEFVQKLNVPFNGTVLTIDELLNKQ